MATRRRRSTPAASPAAIVQTVIDFNEVKKTEKTLGTRKAELKQRILGFLEKGGYKDDHGSIWLDLPEGAPVAHVKNERRVSKNFDDSKAEPFLKKRKLYDQCTTTITVLDEQKVLALFYEDKITEKELDALYTESETFALLLKD